jgi:hypothetical protein
MLEARLSGMSAGDVKDFEAFEVREAHQFLNIASILLMCLKSKTTPTLTHVYVKLSLYSLPLSSSPFIEQQYRAHVCVCVCV